MYQYLPCLFERKVKLTSLKNVFPLQYDSTVDLIYNICIQDVLSINQMCRPKIRKRGVIKYLGFDSLLIVYHISLSSRNLAFDVTYTKMQRNIIMYKTTNFKDV